MSLEEVETLLMLESRKKALSPLCRVVGAKNGYSAMNSLQKLTLLENGKENSRMIMMTQ